MAITVADVTKAYGVYHDGTEPFFAYAKSIQMREVFFYTFPLPVESLTETNVNGVQITVNMVVVGDTIVATLDDPGAPNADFIANFLSNEVEAGGWNAQVQTLADDTNFGRTAIGIFPPTAQPNGTYLNFDSTDGVGFYSITADETINIVFNSLTLTSGFGPVVGTFPITAD